MLSVYFPLSIPTCEAISLEKKNLDELLFNWRDALLYAFGALSASCHAAISTGDPASPNAILSMVSSACTKKSKEIHEAGFSCLEQISIV
ncbi:hypothetical protein CFP56_022103 [Quercus suber]|uniref:Uncharacterized protein n=1 Tax=Quercus suber TaxID=58331 RepID=A0AAW0M0U8_QUESU